MSTAINQKELGPRRVPTIHLDGEDYFVDIRLREFRTRTPPIRCIEFIRFESEEGQRMLRECIILECRHCGQVAVVLRDSDDWVVNCVRCGRQVPQ